MRSHMEFGYIYGGNLSQLNCNEIAHRIWVWCLERQMWLIISHNPGVLNSEADKRSRKFHDQTEWKLDPNILKRLAEKVVCPDVGLFASRLNCQSHPFISWGQDPDPALAVDTFTVNWSRWAVIYAFPPFSLIQKTLASRGAAHCATLAYSSVVSTDPETADTNTNPFASGEESFSVGPLRRSSSSTQTASTSSSLYLPGKLSMHQAFMGELVKSSAHPRWNPPRNSTLPTFTAGTSSALQGTQKPFDQLWHLC